MMKWKQKKIPKKKADKRLIYEKKGLAPTEGK